VSQLFSQNEEAVIGSFAHDEQSDDVIGFHTSTVAF